MRVEILLILDARYHSVAHGLRHKIEDQVWRDRRRHTPFPPSLASVDRLGP